MAKMTNDRIFLATNKNASLDEFVYIRKEPYRHFCTNTNTYLFKAMKETHEQRKTKIDIDEFRSGTTNIIFFGKISLSLVTFI
jgi:hypothetical protein